MDLIKRVYISFGKMFPKSYQQRVKEELVYADIVTNHLQLIGFSFVFTVLVAAAVLLLISLFAPVFFLAEIIIFVIIVVIGNALSYYLLSYSSVQRAKQIEASLPDALQLISSNIRAGITPDKALFMSARPEFGVLSDEIIMIGEETIAGKPIDEALIAFSKRVNSYTLKRVVSLIVEGMRAGGELAVLLEQTANDIKMSEILKKEIQSNIGSYIVFTMMAVLVAAPVLYATSVNFVQMSAGIRETMGNIEVPAAAVKTGFTLLSAAKQTLNINALQWFAVVNLIVSSFFGSLLVGILKEGEEREGVQYIPIFIIISLLIFLASVVVMSDFLKSMAVF